MRNLLQRLMPQPGNVLFTLLALAVFAQVQRAGAIPALPSSEAASTLLIPMQGRVTDSAGKPVSATATFVEVKLYPAQTAPFAVFTETHSVNFVDGTFSIMLGSFAPGLGAAVQGRNELWAGMRIGSDPEMAQRIQLGSAPFAMTVPEGSVSNSKIADRTISAAKLAPRPQTVSIPLNVDPGTNVQLLSHIGYLPVFPPSPTGYARGNVRLPKDWVPGTGIRIVISAYSPDAQSITPFVYYATLQSQAAAWEVEALSQPVATLTANTLREITIASIPASNVSADDWVGFAFSISGQTSNVAVLGAYLEYQAQ